MLNFPVGTALQELGFSSTGEEGQPISLVSNGRNLLVWVTNIFKVKVPVGMRLIREILWLAGYGEDFSTCRTNLVDHTVVNVAPQLGATGRSPKPSVKQQYHKRVLGNYGVKPREAGARGWVELGLWLAFHRRLAIHNLNRPRAARAANPKRVLLAAVATTQNEL